MSSWPGPDKELLEKHPTLYFISVGLKYGPARGHLCAAAIAEGLLKKELTVPKLQAVLYSTAAQLHGHSMTEWVRRAQLGRSDLRVSWTLWVVWSLWVGWAPWAARL